MHRKKHETHYISGLIAAGRKWDVLKILGRVTRLDYKVIERELNNRDDWTILQRLRELAPPVLVHRARPQRRSDLLQRLLPQGHFNNYLDVGCGDMTLTEAVQRDFAANACATDVIQSAQVPPGVVFRKGNGKRIPFPGKFDLITMFHAMHHFEHLDSMLGELSRVSKPNTILVIREHDCAAGQPCWDIISLIHIAYDAVHLDKPPHEPIHMSRTREEWEAILARWGWTAGNADVSGSIDRIYTQVFHRTKN